MLRTWRPHTNYSECHATPTLRTPLRANATRPYNTVSHFAPVLAATLARYCLRSTSVRNGANGSQPRPAFAQNMRARNINSLTTLYMLYGVYVTYIHSPNSGVYVDVTYVHDLNWDGGKTDWQTYRQDCRNNRLKPQNTLDSGVYVTCMRTNPIMSIVRM